MLLFYKKIKTDATWPMAMKLGVSWPIAGLSL